MVGRSTAEVAPAADRDLEVDGVSRVEVFRALGDPTRLAVLDLLVEQGTLCHCDLEEALDVRASRLSFHLKVLRDVGLVAPVRRGRRAHYQLHPDALERLGTALPGARPDGAAAPPTRSVSSCGVGG